MALQATTTAAALLFSSACPAALQPCIYTYCPLNFQHFPSVLPSCSISLPSSRRRRGRVSHRVQPRSAVQGAAVVEEKEVSAEVGDDKRRKLCVANLPWNFSAPDIKNLFGGCGTVRDVEIIKNEKGQSKGFAFFTMGSGVEARAVIDKFDSHELLERIIRVEFAKSLKKPSPPPPAGGPVGETRHKIYVSNLAWKVRSSNLREFFSANYKPVSARVVFDSPSGKSSGYGFVSFATKEEMEAAISELDGKELMGRSLRLKVSERKGDESGSEAAADDGEGQAEES